MRRIAESRPSPKIDPADAEFAAFACEDAEDRKVMRSSLWIAVAVHLLLLLINFPAMTSETQEVEKPKQRAFQVKTYRYVEPPPPPKEPIPRRRVLRKPMPDPTPDAPEPLPTEDPPPRLDLPPVDADFLSIPEAPPPVTPLGPIHVGGDVRRPEKLHAPPPQYTEAARRTGTQGVVIVEAIIDKNGDVTNVRVLKDLPMGLSEKAVQAIKKWKFRPATLNGKPVDVYYNLTVNFQLQQ
jgi:TonB family protein